MVEFVSRNMEDVCTRMTRIGRIITDLFFVLSVGFSLSVLCG